MSDTGSLVRPSLNGDLCSCGELLDFYCTTRPLDSCLKQREKVNVKKKDLVAEYFNNN